MDRQISQTVRSLSQSEQRTNLYDMYLLVAAPMLPAAEQILLGAPLVGAVFRELVGTAPGVENKRLSPRSYGAQSRLVRMASAVPGSRQDWQRTFFGMPDMRTRPSAESGAGVLALTMQRARGRGAVKQPWSHQSYGRVGWWPRVKESSE